MGTPAMVSPFPTLDLLLLTYNCAKSPIDIPVFAVHLLGALSPLPDVVVFSLQEAAPLGYAFAGSYFIAPYLGRFDDALNVAAAQVEGGGDEGEDELLKDKAYTLVRQANVGMTAIVVFARDAAAVRGVEVAECGFGVADMGNKGAVGVRLTYGDTDLTFVATHLAAMEWNVRRRNANWRSIMAGLLFGDPRAVLGRGEIRGGRQGRTRDSAASTPQTAEEEAAEAEIEAGDEAWLLGARHAGEDRRLQDLSVFRRDSLLFVGGDLNYRIDTARPLPGAPFPGPDTWPDFIARDQLAQEQRAGRTLHGLHEAPIAFAPTYKYDVLPDEASAANTAEIRAWQTSRSGPPPIPWRYAPHRWPSWCDRILFLDVPARLRRRWKQGHVDTATDPKVHVTAYRSLPLMRTSDHQPVYLRVRVPLLGKMEEEEEEDDDDDDPRVHPPVHIDPDAWVRREQARRREVLAGCGMLLFNTRGGVVVLLTLALVLVGTYWVWVGVGVQVPQQ